MKKLSIKGVTESDFVKITFGIPMWDDLELVNPTILKLLLKGGSGSGNFGHSGRPGEVGGSGSGGGSLDSWIRGNPTSEERNVVATRTRSSTTLRTQLQRIESNDPKYEVGQVVEYKDGASFTAHDILAGEGAGDIGWKSNDGAVIRILNPKHGLDIDYTKTKGIRFGASNEKETILASKYRVVNRTMMTEPNTNPEYGYKIPVYTLEESDEFTKGGSGSGNFGHSGRPGEIGGSGGGSAAGNLESRLIGVSEGKSFGESLLKDGKLQECYENSRKEYFLQREAGNNPKYVMGEVYTTKVGDDPDFVGLGTFHAWVEVGDKILDSTPFDLGGVNESGPYALPSKANYPLIEYIGRFTADSKDLTDEPLSFFPKIKLPIPEELWKPKEYFPPKFRAYRAKEDAEEYERQNAWTRTPIAKFVIKGGSGSGNFGHSGREGMVGGSGEGGGWLNSISTEEMGALGGWKESSSEIRALQKLGLESKELDQFNTCLNKAPTYEGELYRGIEVESKVELEKFAVGSEITLEAHSSATKSRDISDSFALRGGSFPTVFRIQSKTSKDISDFTDDNPLFKAEKECVLMKGTKYSVTNVSKTNLGAGDYFFTIDMDEI